VSTSRHAVAAAQRPRTWHAQKARVPVGSGRAYLEARGKAKREECLEDKTVGFDHWITCEP